MLRRMEAQGRVKQDKIEHALHLEINEEMGQLGFEPKTSKV